MLKIFWPSIIINNKILIRASCTNLEIIILKKGDDSDMCRIKSDAPPTPFTGKLIVRGNVAGQKKDED